MRVAVGGGRPYAGFCVWRFVAPLSRTKQTAYTHEPNAIRITESRLPNRKKRTHLCRPSTECLFCNRVSFLGDTNSTVRPLTMARRPALQNSLRAVFLSNPFAFTQFRTLLCNGASATPLRSIVSALFPRQRRVGVMTIFPPTVFRIFFQVRYALTPLFATLTKTAGV